MKTSLIRHIVIIAALVFGASQVQGQMIIADLSGPSENLINEEVCFDLTAWNTGDIGYQPYIRLSLPPEMPASSLSVSFLDNPISSIIEVGTFAGDPLEDSNLIVEDPNHLINGQVGNTLVIVNLPVGSLIAGGVNVEVELCVRINGDGVAVGSPIQLEAQPVYRYGDTPTGTNGSIAGAVYSATVTPTLYSISHVVNQGDVLTGNCVPLEYSVNVNIAEQEIVTGLDITADLPSGINYIDVLAVTPGCVVISEPPTDSNGQLLVTCNNANGTEDPVDVEVTYFAYLGDVLDQNSCDSSYYVSQAAVASNEVPSQIDNAIVTGYHILFDPVNPSTNIWPGETVILGLQYQVAEHVEGIDSLWVDLIIPDGLAYLGNATVEGLPLTAASVTDLGDGRTAVSFNLHDTFGADVQPCEVGQFLFEAEILETYFGGDYLTARDRLYASGFASYSLVNGVEGCVRPVATGYNLPPAEVVKELISSPANGFGYVPGEQVVYRLEMTIPSGDSKDVIFEDLFPVPVHDVNDLNLTFGTDITHSPTDNIGATPLSISIDSDKNSLTIDWGSISGVSNGTPTVIAVDIAIPITSEPFADGLVHTNFGRFYSNNSLLEASVDVDLTTINVGAPELIMFKGILETDQPDAELAPVMVPVNANATNIDAWDYVTYQITLTNAGLAPAYDVIVTDFPPFPELGNCVLESVKNGEGDDLPYAGSLFTIGLVLDSIPKAEPGSEVHRVYIDYECRVQDEISAGDYATNTAEATWAAVPGGTELFNPITESAQLFFAEPRIEMNVLDITPGYQAPAGVQVGELVEMEVRVEIPEGFTRDATIQVTLPEGMSLEEITNYEHPDDMYFSAGSSTQVYNAITVEALGQGEENEGRVITMYTGDIDNGSSDNDEAEYLTLGFTATVLNSEVNQNGYLLSTLGTIEYLSPINGSYTTEYDNANLELREPELDVSIEFFEPELLPGGQTFVTITIEHAESSLGHAYNVDIVNDLPLGLQFVNGSFLSECEELLTAPPTNSFGSITCEWDSIPLGVTCELVYSVQVVNGYPPCTEAVNDIELRYTSGFEAHYDTLTYGPVNSLGVRRTGDPTDIGGDLNDHLSIDSSVLDVVSGTLNQPIIVGNDEFCAGAELNIQIPEYAGTFVEYHWEGPGVPDGYNSNQLILPNPVPDDSGEYTVYIQVGQCLSPISDPFQVNVLENPSVVFEDVNVPCISGVDDLILEADVSGGVGPYDFVWSGPNFLSSDSLAVIENASEDNTGVYSLIVTDSQGCSSVEQMAQVSISTAPPTPEIENGVELCEGLNFQLDCNVYPGAEGYHWMTPNGEVITDTPFLTVSGADPLASGEYTVFVQFEECATDPSFSVEAIVHPTPELPEIIANSIELCSGEDLVLTTDAEGDLFTWSGPDGYEFSGSTANPPFIEDIDLLEAGTYELTVTDGICSSETAEIDIIVNPTPNAPGLASNSPLCVGDLLLLTTSSNASAYEWTLPDNSTETTSSGSLTIQETTVTDAGDYLLSVFDGNCWSEPSPIENVQVDVIPSEQAYAGANVVACQDEAVLVQASNDETLTGFWESPGQTLQLASPNNQTTAVTGAQQGETYNLTWSLYTDGCGVYSVDQVTIYAPVDPIANDDVFEMVEGESEDIFVIENDVPGPVEYTIEIVDFPDYGTAQVAENILIEYRPDVNYDGPDEIIYEMCLNDCPTMCDTAIVRIMVFPYLAIPDIITPNNDGANDMLVIEGIERFPDNEIYIYNRWGRKVYSTENYKNDWDATFQGKPLPDGTYYYVFNNRATGENLGTGYITVHQ